MMFPRDGPCGEPGVEQIWLADDDETAHGQSIEAWVGRTSPQPEWTTLPDGRILNGGWVQYLIYDLSKAPAWILASKPPSLYLRNGKDDFRSSHP